ncbi:Peptide deformylase [hydrothermal vent metagenome]|uniref:Peptide deformylase n=1 Tax=hydrothermal vent metagenome TaxID=652676 RepID=A0A1W1D603_9ZZZZ
MLQLITYPDDLGVIYAPDVRKFDEAFFSFIDELKELALKNNLKGLSGPQVGSYYSVVVVQQDDGSFLELINPKILKQEGKIESVEYTSYFPNVPATMTRYEKITVIYEDREKNSHSLEADGELSILLQRKIDYIFGAHFLIKLTGEKKEEFEKLLQEKNNEYFKNKSSSSNHFISSLFSMMKKNKK